MINKEDYDEMIRLLGNEFTIEYSGVFTVFRENKNIITLFTEEEVKSFLIGFDYCKKLNSQSSENPQKSIK